MSPDPGEPQYSEFGLLYNVYLTPVMAFSTAMLLGAPLPFALSFNAGTIDEQM